MSMCVKLYAPKDIIILNTKHSKIPYSFIPMHASGETLTLEENSQRKHLTNQNQQIYKDTHE